MQILDVRKDISRWEEQNSGNLRKLNTLIRRIIDTVQKTIAMKFRVRGSESGNLEIWELDISHQSALPDDLCLKLREDKGLADENEGWKQLGQGSPAKDPAEDYNDSGDDQDCDGRDDESDKGALSQEPLSLRRHYISRPRTSFCWTAQVWIPNHW